jgi:hypothetical protein
MNEMKPNTTRVYLSRRNLMVLLSKLSRKANGEDTSCSIIKNDTTNLKYPQTIDKITITSVEDHDYYETRFPGDIHPNDDTSLFFDGILVKRLNSIMVAGTSYQTETCIGSIYEGRFYPDAKISINSKEILEILHALDASK